LVESRGYFVVPVKIIINITYYLKINIKSINFKLWLIASVSSYYGRIYALFKKKLISFVWDW
jgi:hypothetical protein